MTRDDQRDNTDDKSSRENGEQESVRRPYANDLDKLPRPSDEDPPYRGWWVV